MKTKTIHSVLKIAFCTAFMALFTALPPAVSASQIEKNAQKAQAAQLDPAALSTMSGDELAERALEEQKRAIEASQPAPVIEAPVVAPVAPAPKASRPVTPNGGNPVQVTATAGTMGPTTYATVGAAFAAINAGTHQGDITIDILTNTVEGTTPATLNSSGAGSALYTSVLLRPASDGLSISGNPVTGFGVIQLNGADNVTIDGDNPNSGGINRNLTISNTTTTTVIANSAVRIAVSAAVTNADNNTIKNCVLLGNVTSGNASGITSTAGSSNSSFGIYIGGNGGATATSAPTAITSVTTNTAPSGTTVNNLLIDNNSVNQCARAIVFNGAVATVSNGVTISNNVIGDQGAPSAGPPYTSPATTVYTKGIWVAGTAAANISGNTLKNIMSYVGTTITSIEMLSPVTVPTITNNTITNVANNGTSSIVKAILVSSSTGAYSIAGNNVTNVQSLANSSGTDGIEVTAASPGGTIERNKIQTVHSRGAGTFGAYGLNVTSGTGIVIRNNFVSDVLMDMTGGVAFSTQFSVHGIRIAGGTNHKIYHNSVNLFGSLFGTANSAILTSALEITLTSITGVDLRNNILANNLTGGTTSIAHVSIYLPSGTSAMNLTDNNNDYFFGADPTTQGAGQAGTTAGTNFFTTLAALQAYSMTLSVAGTNDNASLAVDPQFLSSTDLHIAVASPMVDMGASVGVLVDIDGQNRVPPPDIGADEPSGVTPPANDIAAATITTPANGSSFPVGAIVTPQATFTNVGTATQTNVMVQFTITGPLGYSYSNSQSIASITPSQTLSVTFAAAPAFTNSGSYTMAASVTTADANPGNDTVNGAFTVLPPLVGGSYNVPGDYPSLTNAGGIFQALNAAGATGNITINITADLTSETGANALNELGGGITVLIRPSLTPRAGDTPQSARIISGSSVTGNTALIKLNGADNVTIDGSDSGGTDRSLTITNNNAAGVCVWIASASAANGANDNTIKNCILTGTTGQGGTIAGVLAGSGTTFGGAADAPNSNNTIQNCLAIKVQNGAFISGNAASLDQNWVVSGNTFGSSVVAEKLGFRGMLIGGTQNMSVIGNTIMGVSSSTGTTSTMSGIQVAFSTSGGSVSKNKISDIKQNNTAGWGSNGIFLAQASTTADLLVSNNFVSNVASQGFNDITSADNGYGIMVVTGAGYKIYFNSVSMGTNQGANAASGITAAINIAAAVTTAGGIDLRDNIFANTQTLGTRYAILDGSTAGAAIFSSINYNDYFSSQNVGFLTGARVTLADWQTATGQDGMSKAVDPGFVSATDLHITNASPVADMGTPIVGVAQDIDNETRSLTTPDIGADEVIAASPLTANSAVSRLTHGGAGTFSIPLSFASPAGVECRSTGGNYSVVITFSNNVVSGSASVTLGTGSVSGSPTFSTNTMTINLTGVTDVQQITVTASNVTDEFAQVLASTPVPMKMLIGDVNGDSSVNVGDVASTKSQSGIAVTGANFKNDVNVDSSINVGDVALVKSKSGNTLP